MLGKNFVDLCQFRGGSLFCLSAEGSLLLFLFVKIFGVRFALGLQALEQIPVLPTNGVCQVSDDCVVATRFQSHHSEGGGNDHALLLVVGSGDSLECRQTGESFLSTSCLLVHHTTDSSPQHLGGALEVEGTSAGVGVHVLLTELSILDLITCHCKRKRSELA